MTFQWLEYFGTEVTSMELLKRLASLKKKMCRMLVTCVTVRV